MDVADRVSSPARFATSCREARTDAPREDSAARSTCASSDLAGGARRIATCARASRSIGATTAVVRGTTSIAARRRRRRRARAGPGRAARRWRSRSRAIRATAGSTRAPRPSTRCAKAMRSVVAVGARPVGLTDCLNFGNPRDPSSTARSSRRSTGSRTRRASSARRSSRATSASTTIGQERRRRSRRRRSSRASGRSPTPRKTANAALQARRLGAAAGRQRANALGGSVLADLGVLVGTSAQSVLPTACRGSTTRRCGRDRADPRGLRPQPRARRARRRRRRDADRARADGVRRSTACRSAPTSTRATAGRPGSRRRSAVLRSRRVRRAR